LPGAGPVRPLCDPPDCPALPAGRASPGLPACCSGAGPSLDCPALPAGQASSGPCGLLFLASPARARPLPACPAAAGQASPAPAFGARLSGM